LSSESFPDILRRGADGSSGMMSAISEAFLIMNKHMGMKFDDIGKVFEKWNSEGELVRPLSTDFPSFANDPRKIPFSSRLVLRSVRRGMRRVTTFSPTYRTK